MLLLPTRLILIASTYLVQGYNKRIKITAPSIAQKCNVNHRALMPALRRLTQVVILRSQVGGNNPGFILTKDPSQITVFEVIDALENNLYMPSCREISEDLNCKMDNCSGCLIYNLVNRNISNTIRELKNTTLQDLYLSRVKE